MINIESMIAHARAESLARSEQITLGDLIDKMERVASKTMPGEEYPDVRFDFEYAHPTGLSSWRGVYAELALEFSLEGEFLKVDKFLELLKSAVGKSFEGYKGGEYVMSRDTAVWVANPGHTGSTAVTGVIDEGWTVIIETKYINR